MIPLFLGESGNEKKSGTSENEERGIPRAIPNRDVSTGATEVAPKFSDTLTLFPPGVADSAHHRRGRI